MWWLVNRRIININLGFGVPIDIEIPYSGIPQFLHVLSNFYPVPVFFMLTGISLVLSIENKRFSNINKSEIRKYVFKRSFFILVISYFVFNLIIKGPVSNFYQSWDMLQLIGGGSLITYFLLKLSKKFRITVACGIVFLTPFIQILFNYDTLHYNYPVQGGIIANMICAGEFPIFPWLSFIILGSVIGELLNEAVKSDNIILFLKKISVFGLVSMLFGSFIPFINMPPFTSFDKYPCTIPYILFFTGAVLISISLAYYNFDYRKKRN